MLVPCEALALVPLRALETLFRNLPRHLIMPTGRQPPSSSSLYLYSHDSQFCGAHGNLVQKYYCFGHDLNPVSEKLPQNPIFSGGPDPTIIKLK